MSAREVELPGAIPAVLRRAQALAPWWRRRLGTWKSLLPWVAGVIVVAAVAAFSHAARVKAITDLERLQTMQTALAEAATLISLSADLQASQRGYLLAQDPAMLRQFGAAAGALPAHAAALREAVAWSPALESRTAHLQQQLASKLAQLTEVLEVFGQSGQQAAVMLMRTQGARLSLDQIRAELLSLQLELIGAASTQQQVVQANMQWRNTITYVMILLASMLAVGTLVLLRRHLSSQRRADVLRAEVRQSRRESREKSSFLANMSHEIRTPMNAIFGFSRLLQERVKDPVADRYVEAITTSARSLLGLINDILDLSKIEAGRLEIRSAPMSLRETARSVMAVFRQLAAEKGLRLRCRIRPGVPRAVLLDAARVRQILFNLVGNAIKYTDRGEIIIRVAARPDADDRGFVTCVLEVQDTGVGIAPEDQESIFEAFTQGRDVGGREGSGLGLSITRRLAQLMGGDIEVESALGTGSTFRVTLPKVRRTQLARVERRAGDLNSLPALTILVVDDVDINRQLLEAIFENTHHRVLTASSGAEAIEVALEKIPDVVLMDIRMPEMDGIEALRRMREHAQLRPVRVIAVTASNMVGEEHLLRMQFDGFVGKPFNEETLYAELATLFSSGPVAPAQTAPASTVEPVPGPVPAPVLAELERLEATQWPPLCDTLAMHEVRDFAGELAGIAQRGGGASLARYAEDLLAAARHFEVGRTEALLREFPACIRGLRPVKEERLETA